MALRVGAAGRSSIVVLGVLALGVIPGLRAGVRPFAASAVATTTTVPAAATATPTTGAATTSVSDAYVPATITMSSTSGWGGTGAPATSELVAPLPLPGAPRCPSPRQPGHLVGAIGGPNGATAAVCLSGRTLTVSGATQPGTWTGTVYLLGTGSTQPTPLPTTVSVSVHDWWLWPFLVLLGSLLLAFAFPLWRQWRRPLLEVIYHGQLVCQRVRERQAGGLIAVQRAAGDRATGIDTVVSTERPEQLYVDREVAASRAGYDSALDAASRATYLPAGAVWNELEKLAGDACDHFDTLVDAARDAEALVTAVTTHFPQPPGPSVPGPATYLGEALCLSANEIADKAAWTAAQTLATTRATNIRPLQDAWRRIVALMSTGSRSAAVTLARLAADLLSVASPEELTELEKNLNTAEGHPAGQEKALVSEALVRRAVAAAPPPAPRLPSPARLRSRIVRADLAFGAIGGVIVFLSGFATLFLANPTFGSLADWFGLVVWGFGLGTGVGLARTLLPIPELGS